ncbi:MAG: hypothetical protein V5783_09855 [Pontiella sp.]
MKTSRPSSNILKRASIISILVSINEGLVIAGYDFDDGNSNATQAVTVKDPLVTASDYTTGAGLNDIINQGNGNSNYSLLDAEGNVLGTANGFEFGSARSNFGFTDMNNSSNLNLAINNNDYMTFTVTPTNGYVLDLSRFTFRTRVNHLNNSADRWALFSSKGGFTNGAEIVTGQTTDEGGWTNSSNNVVIDLWTEPELQGVTNAVTFRLYIYGGNAYTSSATLFDKVTMNGSGTLATTSEVDDHWYRHGFRQTDVEQANSVWSILYRNGDNVASDNYIYQPTTITLTD